MTLTNAMITGFTGINTNSAGVDTVGNNLANLNTTAFKSQRTLFENLLYQTVSEGEAPSDTSGGVLPRQIGSGSTVAATQRDFAQGGLENTGLEGDLAVDGTGFFLVENVDGSQALTRDGAFQRDANGILVSTSGFPLLAFPADADGNINTATLEQVSIPLGSLGDPTATSVAEIAGKLDGGTEVASVAAVEVSAPLVTATGNAATAATALTDLVDAFGVPLFADGDVVSVGGKKGGVSVAPAQFLVGTTGNTVGDLAQQLELILGLQTDPALGGTPGVVIGDGTTAPAGSIVINSNLGEINAVEMTSGSIVNESGTIASPFSWTTAQEAVGGGFEGSTTSFNVFDSLGNPVDLRLRFVLESKGDGGTTWRFYADSNGDSDLTPAVSSGTISFDSTGRFVAAENTEIMLQRAGSGAGDPLTFTLDFSELSGVSAPDGAIEVSLADQDGKPAGIMTGFSIDAEGLIVGQFSNTDSQVLGQVALATVVNEEGLIAQSENLFVEGVNSGELTIQAPLTGRAGAIRSTFLEQSNVELSREFINLIAYSTGISAASRVVRAADDMLQELVLLAR
ncbi:MAG: flagellar hook protein FlgE [Phycisphaerae bacterium]